MKRYSYIIFLAIVLIFTGCTDDQSVNEIVSDDAKSGVTLNAESTPANEAGNDTNSPTIDSTENTDTANTEDTTNTQELAEDSKEAKTDEESLQKEEELEAEGSSAGMNDFTAHGTEGTVSSTCATPAFDERNGQYYSALGANQIVGVQNLGVIGSVISNDDGAIMVTAPAELYFGMTKGEIEAEAKAAGYESCEVNEDGSVTYILNQETYQQLLVSYKDKITTLINTMVSESDSLYSKIQYNDEVSEFYVYVTPDEDETVYDQSTYNFYVYGTDYQILAGVASKDITVKVYYIDQNTGVVLKSDDLNNLKASIEIMDATLFQEQADTESESLFFDTTEDGNAPTAAVTVEPQSSIIEETVICDQKGIKITATTFTDPEWGGPEVSVTIENLSDRNVTIQAGNTSVNGFMTYMNFQCNVAAGSTYTDVMVLDEEALERSDIDTIGELELQIIVSDTNSRATLFRTGSIVIKTFAYGTFTQELRDDGDVVFEKDGIRIVRLETNLEGILGPEIYFFVENNTNKSITVQTADTTVNDLPVDAYLGLVIEPGKMIVDDLTLADYSLSDNAITTIDSVDFIFCISDTESRDLLYNSELVELVY